MKKILSILAAAALLLSCASAAPVTAAQEDADFAYLCTIPDAELEALCASVGAPYMRPEMMKAEARWGDPIIVNMYVEDYAREGVEDVTRTDDVDLIQTENNYDYDFQKMTADLALPEGFFITPDWDAHGGRFEVIVDGSDAEEGTMSFLKLAQIPINCNADWYDPALPSVTRARLMQVVQYWCWTHCENVHSFSIYHANGMIRPFGDVDSDGTFGVTDIILLQRWLLGLPDTVLAIRSNADFNMDGQIDVLDLGLMKHRLIALARPLPYQT